MIIEKIKYDFSICKVDDISHIKFEKEFCFIGKTDMEFSLVCITEDAPEITVERNDGWRAFRIKGTLDFSLVGILAKITTLLAQKKIGIFAISTFDTDYILTKAGDYSRALEVLDEAGYQIV